MVSDKVGFLNARIDAKGTYISAAYYAEVIEGDPIIFDKLAESSDEIEKSLASKLSWDRFAPKISKEWSLIQIKKEVDIKSVSQADWSELFQRLADHLEKLDSALKVYL